MPVESTIDVTHVVAGLRLVTTVEPSLAAQASSLLRTVAQLADTGAGLSHGVTVDFGGARYVLDGDSAELRVCEPRYGAVADAGALERDVTRTLSLVWRQAQLVQRISVEPADCHLLESFIAPKRLDFARAIYMERCEPTSAVDSGWFIGSAEDDGVVASEDPEDYAAQPIHTLFERCPAAMDALALPVGYLVVVARGAIVGISDPQGNERLR